MICLYQKTFLLAFEYLNEKKIEKLAFFLKIKVIPKYFFA